MAKHHHGKKLALFASAMTIGWIILVGDVSLSFGEYLRLALGAAATVVLGSLCDLTIARGLIGETAGAFLYGFAALAGAVAVPTMIAPNDVAGDRFQQVLIIGLIGGLFASLENQRKRRGGESPPDTPSN